jgi:hypothetical protein
MTGGTTGGEEEGRAVVGRRVVEVVERVLERAVERDAEVVERVVG